MQLPYGFDVSSFESRDDDPWTKLATINEHLEDCTPIPPYLAQWLGLAIRFADRDANEFLRRLELKSRPGRKAHKHGAKAWLEWGALVCRRESEGAKVEEALDEAMLKYAEGNGGKQVSRSQLQEWRDQYREAERIARCR